MGTGKTKTVEPIREFKDIETIKKVLNKKPRDLAMFTLGINTNLRASDIIDIKAKQLTGDNMDELEVQDKRTGRKRRIKLNNQVVKSIRKLFEIRTFEPDDYLFGSRKKGGPLVPTSFSRLVKQWCSQAKLKGNFASHSLRKTWGYHQKVTFGTSIPILMICFNHTTRRQTLDYLCVKQGDIEEVFLNEI